MSLWDFCRAPHDVRADCGTWRAGELAVCINEGWIMPSPHNPRTGDVLRVTQVDEGVAAGVLAIGLSFEGKPADHRWDARGFRKPVADDQPASADFRLSAPAPELV